MTEPTYGGKTIAEGRDLANRYPELDELRKALTPQAVIALLDALEQAQAPLFRLGEFTSASGAILPYKIECDADPGWECLAWMIAQRVKFSSVSGVARGGLKLEAALSKYKSGTGPHLVVDDVFTAGTRLFPVMAQYPGCIGFVAFARGPLPNGVQALFISGEQLEQAVAAERDLVLKIIKDTAERYWRGEWPELSLGDAIEQAIRKGRGE